MSKTYKMFGGIDPSFKGMGTALINTLNKTITFNELSVDVKHGAFAEICKASEEMVSLFIRENSDFNRMDTLIGMEIPPVTGMYAVKLWALDSLLYNNVGVDYLFNVPYLKFINKKYESKKDTKEMINQILEAFKVNGYEIIQTLTDKRGKPRKLTSNECDSFIYAIRMYVKYYFENNRTDSILLDILNINDRFLEEKETTIGKKLS